MIARRSPAPIIEPTENPTPAAQEQTEPKHPTKSKRKSAETEPSEQTKAESAKPRAPQDRFAGTWTGKINQGILGDVLFTLTFTSGGTQVTQHTILGTFSHPTTSNGSTATWKDGLLNEIDWTFKPNADGTTAQVTSKSALGVNGSTVFHRGGAPVTPKTASEFPIAKRVPEKPGFVYNPYDPTAKRLLDVTGKPSGTKIKDPSTGKMFIVP
jgi:hypothetical protein